MSKEKNSLMATAERIKDQVKFKDYAIKAAKSGYICPNPACRSGDPTKEGGSSGSGAVIEGNKEKNTWYCTKCETGGDVLTYLSYQLGYGKKPTGKDFAELVETACKRFGVTPCGEGAIPFDAVLSGKDKLKGEAAYLQSLTEAKTPSQTSEKPRYAVDNSSAVKLTTEDETTAITPDFRNYYSSCCEALKNSPEALEYLAKRGISYETAKQFGVGFDEYADPCCNPGESVQTYTSTARIIIPTSPSHYVGRAILPTANIQKANAKGSHPGLFGFFFLSALKDTEICYVCEGSFDAMSILEAEPTAKAVALNSIENGSVLLEEISKNGLKNKHFVIIPDNESDEAKYKLVTEKAERLIGQINQTGNYATWCNLCSLCSTYSKDTNDYLIADKEGLKAALYTAEGEHYIAIEEMKQLPQNPPIYDPYSVSEEELSPEEEERILKMFGDYDDTDFEGFYDRVVGDTYSGFKTDIQWFDEITGGGLLPGSLVVMLAPPAIGKTSLLQYIAENYADKKYPVRYMNFEMSSDSLFAKALSMRLISYDPPTDLKPIDILKAKNLHESERQIIKDAFIDYKKNIRPYLRYLGCKALSDIQQLKKYIGIIGSRAKRNGGVAPILVIDYLQILGGGKNEDRQETIRQTMLMLKNYAEVYKTLVIIISATNRDSAKEGQLSLESGRDSSNIEFSADYVLTLNHWVVDNGSVRPNDMATLSKMKKTEPYRRLILRQIKGRIAVGETDEARLYFDGAHSTFYEEKELFNNGDTDKLKKLRTLNPNLKIYKFDDEAAAKATSNYKAIEQTLQGKTY